MTTQEWLDSAKADASKLRQLLQDWHPQLRRPNSVNNPPMPITAPMTEHACAAIRQQLRQTAEDADLGFIAPIDGPITRFDAALDAGDVGGIMSVLNEAWFGVPESTSCWRIEGFREAVALLEDPPDDGDSEQLAEQQEPTT